MSSECSQSSFTAVEAGARLAMTELYSGIGAFVTGAGALSVLVIGAGVGTVEKVVICRMVHE